MQQGAEAELKGEEGEWMKVEARGFEYIHYAKRVEAFNAEACAGIGVLYQTALHSSHASRTYLTDIKSTTTRSAHARRLLFQPLAEFTPLRRPAPIRYLPIPIAFVIASKWPGLCFDSVFGDNSIGFEFKISFFLIDFIIKRIIRADRFWCKSKRIFKN